MRIGANDSDHYDPQQSYAAKQLSRYDMQVAGVVVYVVTMTVFFVVALVMMLFRNEPLAQVQPPKAVVSSVAAPAANQLAQANGKRPATHP